MAHSYCLKERTHSSSGLVGGCCSGGRGGGCVGHGAAAPQEAPPHRSGAEGQGAEHAHGEDAWPTPSWAPRRCATPSWSLLGRSATRRRPRRCALLTGTAASAGASTATTSPLPPPLLPPLSVPFLSVLVLLACSYSWELRCLSSWVVGQAGRTLASCLG